MLSFVKPLFLFIFLLCQLPLQVMAGAPDESATAAREWLELIDQKKYVESWHAGSKTLQMSVPQKYWVTLMTRIREPFGLVKKRTVLEQKEAKDPKGLPKGDYMVLFFDTSFSERQAARELVTLVQESDGKWRVLTYQVQ